MNIEPTIENTKTRNILLIDKDVKKVSNYRVYKHNKMVECKSNFSAIEHRIIVLAMAQITLHDGELKMYRINIRDVLGKKHSSHYNLVRKAVEKLQKSTIAMDESDGWKSYSFITKAQGKYGKNYIEIQFHEDIQKFLLGLKSHYTSYTLQNVINFKKNYSLRIYELCKQYQKIGCRTLKLDYLKTLLSLEDKYELYPDFRRFVLKSAIEEIKKFSDIDVSFTEVRDGRTVESIKFFITRKRGVSAQEGRTLEEIGVEYENLLKLETLGFDDDDYHRLRDTYGLAKMSGVLALYDENIDTIKFPKAWIENALKEGYVNNLAYKKQLARKEDTLKQMSDKIKERISKKTEITALEEGIYYMNIDLDTYRTTGALKPGDVMRYPADFTVDQAMEAMGKRIAENNELIEVKQKELAIIESEIDRLV